MKSFEKMQLPHAVYRIFAADGSLLYIGCSYAIMSRLANHGSFQPWIQDVARIEIAWYPDEIAGKRAEAGAILAEHPRYNRLLAAPEAIGTKVDQSHGRAPRGDGSLCPKCKKQKERRQAAYCNSCYKEYRAQRRLLEAAGPT